MKRWMFFVVVWCCPLGLFAQAGAGKSGERAEALFNQAGVFIAGENWYQAAELLLEAVDKNPAHAGAVLALADCYYELAEYDQALVWARKARALARLQAEAANLEAFILIALGRLNEASALIDEVLKREPYNREALFAACELDIARGRAGDAVRRYREAARLYPNDRRLLVSLALVLGSLGDTNAARGFIERAQLAHPDDYRVFYYAAYLKARAGQLAGAAGDVERALQLRPAFAPARDLLAQIRYREGEYQEAVRLMDAAIAERRDNPGAWFLRGMAYMQLGQGALARRSFEAALGIDPNDEWSRCALETSLVQDTDLESPERARLAAWHSTRAAQYRERNMSADALFEYRRALRLNPYAAVRADYAALLRQQGFPRRYLEELLFIQNEGGGANKAVNDAIETYSALLKTGFAARNPVGNEEIKPRWNIAVFSVAQQSSFFHADAAYLACAYIKDISVHSRNFQALELPARQGSFAAAFRSARERRADYFMVLSVAESERDLSINAVLYVARTGSRAAEFTVYRAGGDRLRNASRAIVDQLGAALPFRGVLLRRVANQGVIDKGRLDNLQEGQVFNVVKAGKAEVRNEGIGVNFLAADVVGSFTVKQLDEAISGGELTRNGFFDLIAEGDEIFAVSPDGAAGAAGQDAAAPPSAVPPAQDPELRSLLRSLR
ncbi:MAG: tetratricopeptide repeat protein [Spirochaetaceae bacterium]|jgi:tetratricopeptide (TPR) repeat protein|nr:tetratricopeptide repeat protein [Spirochaetaceae bacterium]